MIRTADVLGALSAAADLALGMPEGHAARSCYLGMALANRLNLSAEEKATVYYSELLMDAGCTSWAGFVATAIMGDEIGARRDFYFYRDARNPLDALAGSSSTWRWVRQSTSVPSAFWTSLCMGRNTSVKRCRTPPRSPAALLRGSGCPTRSRAPSGRYSSNGTARDPIEHGGDAIPMASRIVAVTSLLEAFYAAGGRKAALRIVRARRGKAFDPLLVEVFLSLARDEAFWEGFEEDRVWETVLSMEPLSPHRFLPAERLEDVAMAFADFADLKSFFAVGHSRQGGRPCRPHRPPHARRERGGNRAARRTDT